MIMALQAVVVLEVVEILLAGAAVEILAASLDERAVYGTWVGRSGRLGISMQSQMFSRTPLSTRGLTAS